MFVVFQKYPTKMISCDFRRVITMSDKIDVGPLETLKKWNVFWEQCVYISQVCHEHQWADMCGEFWQIKDYQSSIVGVLFTTFSDFFRLIKLNVICCHYELCWNTEILAKVLKSCVIIFAIDIWSTFLGTVLFFLIAMLFFLSQCFFSLFRKVVVKKFR